MDTSSIIVSKYTNIISKSDIDANNLGVTIPFPHFKEDLLFNLLNDTLNVCRKLPSIYELEPNIYIVGDLHGNIRDLIRILKSINFLESDLKILFLGDYVDKGNFSLEVITLLFSLLLQFPERIFLLRGNHEFSNVNVEYGFKDELYKQYKNDRLWEKFNSVFNWLPIAALIGNKIICFHGGISPQLKNIDQIRSIERPISTFRGNNLLTDIMWADPNPNISYFNKSERGYGRTFGQEAINEFCSEFCIEKVIRSHQCIQSGIEFTFCDKLITVFSCSNYCDTCKNQAAYLYINGESIDQFILQPLNILKRNKAIFFEE